MKDALDFIEQNTIKLYRNDWLPNERTYRTYKSALIGSIYHGDIGWFENTILYKGMTPKDFLKLQGTKEWFELPLFRPDFSRYKEL
jgi:hypothetical protein